MNGRKLYNAKVDNLFICYLLIHMQIQIRTDTDMGMDVKCFQRTTTATGNKARYKQTPRKIAKSVRASVKLEFVP